MFAAKKLKETLYAIKKLTLYDHGYLQIRMLIWKFNEFMQVLWLDAGDIFEGVPPYPLYKRLALALHQSIVSGAFCGRQNKMVLPMFEDISMKQKAEWNQLIMDKGHQLINVSGI